MAPTYSDFAPSFILGTNYFVDSCSVQSTREAWTYNKEGIEFDGFINYKNTKIVKLVIYISEVFQKYTYAFVSNFSLHKMFMGNQRYQSE